MQLRLETFILLTGILKKRVTKDNKLMNHIKEVETVLLKTDEKMVSGIASDGTYKIFGTRRTR
jgi:hypothetical protein